LSELVSYSTARAFSSPHVPPLTTLVPSNHVQGDYKSQQAAGETIAKMSCDTSGRTSKCSKHFAQTASIDSSAQNVRYGCWGHQQGCGKRKHV